MPTNDAEYQTSETGGKEDPRGAVTAKHIRDLYDRGVRAMRKSTNDYELVDSFLSGEQWLYRNNVTNSLQQLPREPSRVRVSVNRLWPASRTLMAKLLSRTLQFEVQPSDSDDATTRGAYIAEALLSHLHRERMWEQAREEHAWSTWKGGTAALSLDWDARGGRSLGQSETGKPVGSGEVVESVLSVSEFVVEPGTRNAERSNWWIRAQALPPDEVQERYGLTEPPAPDAAPGTTPAGRLLQGDRQSQVHDLTLVLTFYERPHARRPKGAVATVVGEKLVDGPHPWPFPFKDRLNLVVARETVVPGRWYGDTILQAAIPVQVAFNASWSTIIEHMKLAGNARLMIPEGSMDLMDELTDLPSEIMPYVSSQGAPSFLSPPQMPQWWIEQPVRLAQEMDDIIGVHDVSRGNAPRNIESGAGLAILAEADSTPLGRLTKELADAWGRFASLVLETYAAKVQDTRKARLVIPGQGIETIDWTGPALMGQTAALVPLEAVMPRNRAALRQWATDMWDRKIITDPIQFARIADLARQDDFIDGLDPDVSRARWENHQMAMDRVTLIEPFDDHAIHIREHNVMRKMQPVSAPVLAPTGWTTMGDLRVGDSVVSRWGKPAVVVDVVDHGRRAVYRLTFSDGSSAEAGDEHLWVVKDGQARFDRNSPRFGQWGILSTKEMLRWGQRPSAYRACEVPMTEPVHFAPGAALPMDAYTLGAILGDGCIRPNGTVTLISADPEILGSISYRATKSKTRLYTYSLSGPEDAPRKLGPGRPLRALGLAGKRAWEKTIPSPYMTAPVEDRLALLRGLMDTDGWAHQSGAGYCSTSKRMAEQVVELVQSLGGTATTYRKSTPRRPAWELHIRIPVNPFRLSRKAERWVEPNRVKRILRSIELVRYEDSRCIGVDSDDGTYLTSDYIVTHNSRRYGAFSPERRELYDLHVQSHEVEAHAEAGKQMAKSQLIGGAAGSIPTGAEEVMPMPPPGATGPLAAGPPGLARAVEAEKQAPPAPPT